MTSPPFLLLSPPHHSSSPSQPRPPTLPVAAKVSHPPHCRPPRRLCSSSPSRSAALPVASAPRRRQGPPPSPSPPLPVAAKIRRPPSRLHSPSPPRSAALPVAAAAHRRQGPPPSPLQLLPIAAKVRHPPHHGSSHSPSPPRSTARGTHCYPLALTNSELCFQQDQIIQPEPQCRQCPTRPRWRPPPRCPTAAALRSLWLRPRLPPVLHHRRRSRRYTLPFPWHIVRF